MNIKVRELLRRHIMERISFLRSKCNGVVIETPVIPLDNAERASIESDCLLTISLREKERYELRILEDVILRIDDDSYGQCEDCAGDIPIKRLEACPWTTQCVTCKEKEETGSLKRTTQLKRYQAPGTDD